MRDLAFLLSWVVLLPLALQGAHLGVLLWTWTSLLAPNDVLYGFGASVPFGKLAAALTLVLAVAGRGGGIRWRMDSTVWILFAFLVAGTFSQSLTLMADSGDGWELFQKFWRELLLAALVIWVMRDRVRIHALLLAICLGEGFIGVGEGAKFLLSGGGHKVLGSASTGDNNQIALDVLLILPILQYLYATARHQALRVACAGTGVMCMIAIIATASRGGFVGLVLVGLASILSSRRKLPGIILFVLLGVVGSQLVSKEWVERMDSIQAAEEDDSFMGRVGAWKISTMVALDRPLIGGGFHAIQHAEVWTPYRQEVSALDFLPTPPPSVTPKAAHSIYFEVLGDLGFTGLLLFLLLFWTAWRNAGRVRAMVRQSGREDLAWAADLAAKLRVSIFVFLVSGALLSAVYYDIDYLLVGLLAALRGLVADAIRTQPAVPRGTVLRQPRLPAAIPARALSQPLGRQRG